MEEYRNSDFNSLSNGQFSVTELPNGQGTIAVTNNVEGAPQADIKEVELTIAWTFRRNREVKVSTYIARGGIKK